MSIALTACMLIAATVWAGDITSVRLAGTPAEIGRIWGEINKAVIVRDLDVNYLKKAAKEGISEETLLERAKMFIRIAQEIAPHWLEETRAIARAAGVREDLYLAFVATVTRSLFLHECTSYSVSPQHTLNGAILFHKTRDNKTSGQAAFLMKTQQR